MIKARINFKTIHRNLKTLRTKLNPGVKVCAVVKANAYGLGDIQITKAIDAHIDWYGVAKISEAVRLREMAGITKPILLFGVCDDYKTAANHNLTVTVSTFEEMQAVCNAATKIHVHIKVNTGMNRFGINSPWQLKKLLGMAEQHPGVIIGGLYTHMSHEMDNLPVIERQLKKFVPFRAMMRRYHPRAIIHAACSGSSEYKPAQFDMVRVGKAMYGGYYGYQTAITVTAKICAVQHIQKNCGVSYNAKFIALSPIQIGIVSCGYADCGYLNFGHTTHVHVGKVPCKIIGAVCMDTFVIDVTDLPNPLGKTVTLIANNNKSSLMNFVKENGKSACPMLCSLNFSRTETCYD